MEEPAKKKKQKWFHKLRVKYRLILLNEETYEEKISFRLSRMNVFLVLGTIAILLIIITTYIIAFTPLREYIPGYMDVDLQRQVYELQLKADSIEKEFQRKDFYLQQIKRIINGEEIPTVVDESYNDSIGDSLRYDEIQIVRSKEDSLLRAEIENQDQYDLRFYNNEVVHDYEGPSILFVPLEGIISNEFDPANGHYGVDIVSDKNETIKAVLDGIVLFSSWTVETGYVIGLQHPGSMVSIYKHNSVLLKAEGDYVKAGEPIAIVGESGELSTGPHLHFELWLNGAPVNPRDYIAFYK